MTLMTSQGLKRRSRFNLSHTFKCSADMGNLFPVLVEDVVPGDTFKLKTDVLVRFSPQLAPIMHEVDCHLHAFYVPSRIVFDQAEEFITTGERGTSTDIVAPFITAPAGAGWAEGSLFDYLGVPTEVADIEMSAEPVRAYNLILNEWYRQEDLQDPLVLSKAAGEDTTTDTRLYNRNWNRDYFTSALPTQQKGPAVNLPLVGNAPVVGTAPVSGVWSSGPAATTYVRRSSSTLSMDSTGSGTTSQINVTTGSGNADGTIKVDSSTSGFDLQADLSQVTAATVSDLRVAFQLQKFKELLMRGGARYTEYCLSMFGVHTQDSRLQRPEFLGGTRSPVIFSEVLQTSSTDGTSPQGNLAGHGFATDRTKLFHKSFPEHGWVMVLMSVMPKSGYSSQGIPRMYSRKSPYDYLIPLFSHLGEQPVLNKEIYADGTAEDDAVFGFQPRYQEYRKRANRIAGQFRSTLDFWHLARKFAGRPVLNGAFINCNPTDRIFAVTDPVEQTLQINMHHKLKAVRPLPKYGIPGKIDQSM